MNDQYRFGGARYCLDTWLALLQRANFWLRRIADGGMFYSASGQEVSACVVSNYTQNKPVLLAEDDENDVLLMRHAFDATKVLNPLVVVRDGQEAIWYLEAAGAYADRSLCPWPDLLLLDLKMPLKDGWDVLEWLQKPERRKNLHVLVLSSSNDELDIKRAIAMGANGYRVKPFDFNGLVHLAEELRDCWLASARAGLQERRAA
jgi:CheY-like chemotaxis protein